MSYAQDYGSILVLSGPSGAGKSTIINKASDQIGDYYFSISTTTREPRDGEIDGVEYHFVTKQEFEEDIEAGNFLEYALVHNNYYGTSMKPVVDALNCGKLVIFDIDVQGHRLVRDKMGDITTSVFITPPSLKELEFRLTARSSDSPETIKTRLSNAKEEIKEIGEYDFVIINDEVGTASSQFVSVAKASRLKMNKEKLENLISLWQN
jgi:guanylate kinase